VNAFWLFVLATLSYCWSRLHVALQMKAYFETYQLFFRENLPQLFAHFSALQISPDIYIIDWSVLITVL